MPEEEGEQQRADVTAVDVRVGHAHYAVVAHLLDVEVVADAAAHRGDEVANDLEAQNLVKARLLDVENLAAHRKDRLELPVAAALRGATRGQPLDDVELGQRGIAFRAVGELAGESAGFEQALALHEIARLARRLTRARRGERLLDDAPAF